jgi:hypothetical protein
MPLKPIGPTRIATRRRLTRGLAAVLAAGLMMSAPPAHAEDDEESSLEETIIRSILGTNPSIDYRERSPLVVPPSRELPPPDAGAVQGANAAWPQDPDRARRERASRGAAGPVIDEMRRSAQPLTPGEMRRGARAGAGRNDGPARTYSDAQEGRPLTPAELGETRGLFGIFSSSLGGEKPATFTKEPDRSRLTQPPAGYQTPSATQPYRAPKGTGILSGISNPFDRAVGESR